ncbi:hypothetical protein F5146DRAFT_999485 [Armillaria mellea]|nr:hypothetical protein F5146DRAFT_999485 [Armillaria mellea]
MTNGFGEAPFATKLKKAWNDPLPPRHTWREFLGIRFNHCTVQEHTDDDEFLRQPDPDPTIVERILEGFLACLERKGYSDDLLPIYLDLALHRLQSRLPGLDLVDEHVVRLFHAQLQDIIDMAVVALTGTDVKPQGNSTWVTRNTRTHTRIKTIAIEGKRPRVLFHHAPGLQLENNYVPNVEQVDAKAMATIVLKPFGCGFTSHRPRHRHVLDIFPAEYSPSLSKKCYFSQIIMLNWCLPTTTSFETIIPTSAGYPFITADRCCQKGIPLLAILTFLFLPNESVRQGILPAVRNVISGQEIPWASTRLMTDTPTDKQEVSNPNDSENAVLVGTVRASTAPHVALRTISHHVPLPIGVEVSELLSYGPTTQVWRGCLSSRQGTIPVIVKMFLRRNIDYMKKEVLAYDLINEVWIRYSAVMMTNSIYYLMKSN